MFIDSLPSKYFDCGTSKFTIVIRFRFITGAIIQIARDKTEAIRCEANQVIRLRSGYYLFRYSTRK